MELEDLYNFSREQLKESLSSLSIEELTTLLKMLEINFKSHESHRKILLHAVEEIYMTGVFKRIAKGKNRDKES